jgi:hypothetical protein
MGRYYSGDIEGKFWVAVQPSDDASNFGGRERIIEDEDGEEIELGYSFYQEDISDIEYILEEILEDLGDHKEKLDNFFSNCESYSNENLKEILDIPLTNVDDVLKLYSRLELGNKILECVKRTGECKFECEL